MNGDGITQFHQLDVRLVSDHDNPICSGEFRRNVSRFDELLLKVVELRSRNQVKSAAGVSNPADGAVVENVANGSGGGATEFLDLLE